MWQDLISDKYIALQADESVSKGLKTLKEEKFLIILKNKKFFGVATKKSLLRIGVNFPNEKLESVAIKPPYVTKDNNEWEVANFFVESGLPKLVVFKKEKILGVIDRIDFLKEIVSKVIGAEPVETVATTDLVTIKPNDNLAKALALFKEHNISKLPVVKEKLVGVITLTNILNYFMTSGSITVSHLRNTLVKDVMKTEVYWVDKKDTIRKAINIFAQKNTSSLIVKDQGTLFGIVTKTDILSRFVAETKEEALKITIASKIEDIDEDLIYRKLKSLERVLPENSTIFVYLKQGKERFRGQPLIQCRLRAIMPGFSENISVEGWGLLHALALAVNKLKRKLVEEDFF